MQRNRIELVTRVSDPSARNIRADSPAVSPATERVPPPPPQNKSQKLNILPKDVATSSSSSPAPPPGVESTSDFSSVSFRQSRERTRVSAVQRLVERKLAQKEKDKAKQVGSLTHFDPHFYLLLFTSFILATRCSSVLRSDF